RCSIRYPLQPSIRIGSLRCARYLERSRCLGSFLHLLRISVSAMLGKIQTDNFFLFCNTKTNRYFQNIQDDEGSYKHERHASYDTHCLNAQLFKSAAVQEARLTYAYCCYQIRVGENTVSERT